ncbi:N-acetylated-alpha-linked acidic dipeptidase 2-like isoform X2 [Ornithodoros turicata]|uniref:N-acetylated-alpha-linked acidic dipeptidase 2-like isoform X2 n=1 Tax=Ornithodoros turicata TaxID=34597 RepID=UPI0031399950
MAIPPSSADYSKLRPGQRIEATTYQLRVTSPSRPRSASADGREATSNEGGQQGPRAQNVPRVHGAFEEQGFAWQHKLGDPSQVQRTASGTVLRASTPTGHETPSVRTLTTGAHPYAMQRTASGTLIGPMTPSQEQYPLVSQAPTDIRTSVTVGDNDEVSIYVQLRRTTSGALLTPVRSDRQYPGQQLMQTPSGTVLGRMTPAEEYPGGQVLRTPSGTLYGAMIPGPQFPGQRLMRTPSGVMLAPYIPGQQYPGQPYVRPALPPRSPSARYFVQPPYRTPSGRMLHPVSPGQQFVRAPSGIVGPTRALRPYPAPGRHFGRPPMGVMMRPMGPPPFRGAPPYRTPSGRGILPPITPPQQIPPSQLFRSPSGTILAPYSPSGTLPGHPLRTSSGTLLTPVSPSAQMRQQFPQSGTILAPVSLPPGLPPPRSPSRVPSGQASPSMQYMTRQVGHLPIRGPGVPSQSMFGTSSLGPSISGSSVATRAGFGRGTPSQVSVGGAPRGSFAQPRTPTGFVTRTPVQGSVRTRAPLPGQMPWRMNQPRGGTPVQRSPERAPLAPGSGQMSPKTTLSPATLDTLRKHRKSRLMLLEWMVLWVFIVTLAVILLAVLVVVAFTQTRLNEGEERGLELLHKLTKQRYKVNDNIEKELIKWPSEKNIRSYLKELSKNAHLAGTAAGAAASQYVLAIFKSQHLDDSLMERFSVFLSLPSDERPNRVGVRKSANKWHPLSSREKEIPGTADAFSIPFNAYAPNGTVSAKIFYCNYCLKGDFKKLEEMKISLLGKICLCRYSPLVSPGTAMRYAEHENLVAVVFFLDPADVAPDSGKPVYPNNWWMPPSALRRANMRSDTHVGDPSTRGYSSRQRYTSLPRPPVSDMNLPVALSQPISSAAAAKLMGMMQGQPCPQGWTAKLDVTCNLGDSTDTIVRVHINNKLQLMNVENVLGYIRGATEPDRYVVLGVPIDAWSAGAVSPGTATAQALEVSNVMGNLVHEKKWRPRRTILFAAWDAHEFGHIGATEYTEGMRESLISRTVLYVNSDICSAGGKFMVSGSPTVATAFEEATKVVPHYSSSNMSYYDVWKADKRTTRGSKGRPQLPDLRGNGGHRPLVNIAGIPSLDVSFGNNYTGELYYPAYGTGYDTFDMVDHFTDPGFKVQKMCTQLIAVILRMWADADILPYDIKRLRSVIHTTFEDIRQRHADTLNRFHIDTELVRAAIVNFGKKIDDFWKHISTRQSDDPIMTRQLNDKIMHVERIFVRDMPGESGMSRNIMFGWSSDDPRRMMFFPVLEEWLSRQEDSTTDFSESINMHMTQIAYALDQAAEFVSVNRPY